jgi:hypothetical protein
MAFAVITIGCPSCRRRLCLPGGLQGQLVQCPGCGQAFTATASLEAVRERSERDPPPGPPRRPAAPEAVEVPRRVNYATEEGEVPCPYCGEYIGQRSRRCGYCGEALEVGAGGLRPFWVRRDCEPHRGSLIYALGVVSVILGVLAFFLYGLSGLVALPLGASAWVMAARDLPKMEAGLMDPAGMSSTRTGRSCGIIGLVLSLVFGTGYCLLFGLRVLR